MKRFLKITAILAIAVGGYFTWNAEQPIQIFPSDDWEASISSPDFSVHSFRVAVEGAELEAMALLTRCPRDPVALVHRCHLRQVCIADCEGE